MQPWASRLKSRQKAEGNPFSGGAGLSQLAMQSWKLYRRQKRTERKSWCSTTRGKKQGLGGFNLDFLLYHVLGIDLSSASKATIETLRLPPRLLMPFLVLVVVSLFTPRNRKEALDRYYTKMKTEVNPDPDEDRTNLEASLANPDSLDDRRIFPNSDWEFVKPRPKDVIGFLVAVGVCVLIIGLLAWLAGIGS